MKVRLAHKEHNLPGCLVITAETDEELFMLRVFGNWPAYTKEVCASISPCGGNTGEGRGSINISWLNQEGRKRGQDARDTNE